jgi:hypothetical protein
MEQAHVKSYNNFGTNGSSIRLAPVGQTGHLQIVERMRGAGLRLSGLCSFSRGSLEPGRRSALCGGCMKPIPPDGLGNSREESNAGSLSQSAGAREIDPYLYQHPSAVRKLPIVPFLYSTSTCLGWPGRPVQYWGLPLSAPRVPNLFCP